MIHKRFQGGDTFHNKAIAFVQFKEEAAAYEAIARENGQDWDGSAIQVRLKETHAQRPRMRSDTVYSDDTAYSEATIQQPYYPGMHYPNSAPFYPAASEGFCEIRILL